MSQPNLRSILHRVQRPGRYVDGEWNAVRKAQGSADATVALCYPDAYEVGMSDLELRVLYRLINASPRLACERAFTPWSDMAAALRQDRIALYSLESKRPLSQFDLLAFVLGHETQFTNVLETLELVGVPVRSSGRNEVHPLVLGLGSRLSNPEPLAAFFDLFIVGEPEEAALELLELYVRARDAAAGRPPRAEFLALATAVAGVYAPSLYQLGPSGAVQAVCRQVPAVVQRREVSRLPPPVTDSVVPYLEVVNDRGLIEVQRDCGGHCAGCRSGGRCQRLRERPVEEVAAAVEAMVRSCGYREFALLAPVTDDYMSLMPLVQAFRARYPMGEFMLSLPPLHANLNSGAQQLDPAHRGRLLASAEAALKAGWTSIKLRCLLGQPGCDEATLRQMADLVSDILELGRSLAGRKPKIRVEATSWYPRIQTAHLGWVLADQATLVQQQAVLRKGLRKLGAQLSVVDPDVTYVTAALAMGDRRVGDAVERAWRAGAGFDGWRQRFDYGRWKAAFDQADIDPDTYVRRPRSPDAKLPWSHILPVPPAPSRSPQSCVAAPCPICDRLAKASALLVPPAAVGAHVNS